MSDMQGLLVEAFRKIVAGRGRCPVLAASLSAAAHCDGTDLLRTVAILLSAIDNGCRRPVTVCSPGAPGATPDEARLLTVIAAAQQNDEALLSAHLAWLVEKPHERAVAIAARIVGRMLSRGGVVLAHAVESAEALVPAVLTA